MLDRVESISFVIDGNSYVLSSEARPGARDGLQPVGTWELRRLLRRLGDDGTARARLRANLGDFLPNGAWQDHGQFIGRLEALLTGAAPRLEVLRRVGSLRASNLVDAPMDELVELLPAEDAPQTEWIEVVVVDRDEEPIPYVAYEIELSDGRVRSGKTNEHGILRYDGLPPGTCKVRLPELDDSSWELA